MEITVKRLVPDDDLTDAYSVRTEVFVDEQGFSAEIEIDDTDPVAHHVVLYSDGEAIATGRTFPKPEHSDVYILGRIAVLARYRMHRLGARIMTELEAIAKELGAVQTELGAQCSAAGFYERMGYTAFGEIYMDEHCEHIHMRKDLSGKQ